MRLQTGHKADIFSIRGRKKKTLFFSSVCVFSPEEMTHIDLLRRWIIGMHAVIN